MLTEDPFPTAPSREEEGRREARERRGKVIGEGVERERIEKGGGLEVVGCVRVRVLR